MEAEASTAATHASGVVGGALSACPGMGGEEQLLSHAKMQNAQRLLQASLEDLLAACRQYIAQNCLQ